MSIDGDASGVTGCHVQQRGDDTPQELPVDGVFIYVAGSKPITGEPCLDSPATCHLPPPCEAASECMQIGADFIEEKVDYQDDGGVAVDDKMMTSVDGIYAIGDIRNTPYKQVVVAASDGCIAAMSIDRFLKGRKNVRVDWIHK